MFRSGFEEKRLKWTPPRISTPAPTITLSYASLAPYMRKLWDELKETEAFQEDAVLFNQHMLYVLALAKFDNLTSVFNVRDYPCNFLRRFTCRALYRVAAWRRDSEARYLSKMIKKFEHHVRTQQNSMVDVMFV